jgi:hypothetical protein
VPENLAPGRYVEETSFRSKAIEGVGTSTCAFVGPTLEGPVGRTPEVLTSFEDFERIYGGVQDFAFGSDPLLNRNYVAHAARSYFENGGARLYVMRVSTPGSGGGTLPSAQAYADGLGLLPGLEDVSTVACPGYSARAATDYQGIQDALLTHVGDPRRYRFGVLDAPPDQTPSAMRNLRASIDSTRAALYYPWVVVSNPLAGPHSAQPAEIAVPPSGFVCGIYARNDVERGVWTAPANAIVRGALRFERNISNGEQKLLNPNGVNCLRDLPGRGLRVWGARTISSDPEWKYVNVRRYFNYLESSVDRGTQWVVFEPNGEMLWAKVRGMITDFLLNQWRSGALLGTRPEEAFFVRCDRTTMTLDDLDNGCLVCLVGVAVVKPAEFVIFRIAQKAADAKR